MPKLEDIRLGVSPLTDRVYLGTVSKRDPGAWAQKRDAVSDLCQAVLTWVPPGTAREIVSSDGTRYEIEVRELKPAQGDAP